MGEEAGPAKSEFPWPQRRGLLHAKNQPTNIRFRLYAKKTCPPSGRATGKGSTSAERNCRRTGCFDHNFVGSAKATCINNASLKRLFGIEGR